MKFCKDCKWCVLANEFNTGFFCKKPSYNSFRFAQCTRPEGLDHVSGKAYIELRYCSTARKSSLEGSCSKEAKYWEPKE